MPPLHKKLVVRTHIKAGAIRITRINHARSIKVKTGAKAGALSVNHNAPRR